MVYEWKGNPSESEEMNPKWFDIKKLPIIEEQKNIVSKLNKISGLINSKMEQLELLDELIKSQFVEYAIFNSLEVA